MTSRKYFAHYCLVFVFLAVLVNGGCSRGKFRSALFAGSSAEKMENVAGAEKQSSKDPLVGDANAGPESCLIQEPTPKGRKKTNIEIRYSLEDLTGYSLEEAAMLLTPNPGSETFPSAAGPVPWDLEGLDKQIAFAEYVAIRLQRDDAFAKRYGLDPDRFSDSDVRPFVTRIALMFLGAAASEDLIESLFGEYDLEAPARKESFYRGVRASVFRLILDPHFLYEVETAEGRDAFWTARRLALVIWRSVPDRELLLKAASGAFESQDGMVSEIRRMIASPKSKRAFQSFVREWLAVDTLSNSQRSLEKYANFSSELLKEMETDYVSRVMETLYKQKGKASDLLKSEMTNAPQNLQGILGGERQSMTHVAEPSSLRKGILAHPALATLTSVGDEPNAVKRATYTLKRFLCIDLPPPPGGANVFKALDLGPSPTTRERFDVHSTNPSCASCHSVLDGVGLAMEQYDALGYFRSKYDSGREIDPSGSLAAYGKTISFSGVDELQTQLHSQLRDSIDRCLTRHIVEHSFRSTSSDVSKCEVDAIHDRASKGGIEDMLIQALLTPGFWAR